jgi:Helicase conserved C-terminal domain
MANLHRFIRSVSPHDLRNPGSAEKAIIFTESRRTQEYLVRLLSRNAYDGKLVLFNGSNSDPQSKAIYDAWVQRHKGTDRVTSSRTADMRAALVDYFREKAAIMIATEAAAEGINLQFCSMVVNYDLPWNPQRIEQRIGRCHRYGQRYDVVVVNFLNKNNAADQRVYELLAEKFKLFSGVFGASDEVLGAIESGVEFEKRIVSIYQNCRSTEEIEEEFERLRGEMEVNISVTMEDTRRKLLENFDAEVHDRLKVNMTQSKEYLDRYARMLWALTKHELGKHAKFDDDYLTFMLKAVPDGIKAAPGSYYLSRHGIDGHRYRLGHPLAQHLLSIAASRKLSGAAVVFDYTAWPQTAVAIELLVGKPGTLVAHKLSVRGSDDQDHIILAAMTDDGARLDPKAAMRLFELPARKNGAAELRLPDTVRQTVEKQRKAILDEMAARQSSWFDEEMDKLDNWADDRRAGLKADLKELDEQIKALKKEIRQTGNLPDKLALQRQARNLETKRDEAWRAYDAAAKEIEVQKDGLLDQVEERLGQSVSDEELFAIRFQIQ